MLKPPQLKETHTERARHTVRTQWETKQEITLDYRQLKSDRRSRTRDKSERKEWGIVRAEQGKLIVWQWAEGGDGVCAGWCFTLLLFDATQLHTRRQRWDINCQAVGLSCCVRGCNSWMPSVWSHASWGIPHVSPLWGMSVMLRVWMCVCRPASGCFPLPCLCICDGGSWCVLCVGAAHVEGPGH